MGEAIQNCQKKTKETSSPPDDFKRNNVELNVSE